MSRGLYTVSPVRFDLQADTEALTARRLPHSQAIWSIFIQTKERRSGANVGKQCAASAAQFPYCSS